MATQLLNADADLVTSRIFSATAGSGPAKVLHGLNLKVQRDYFKAMKVITQEEGGERVMNLTTPKTRRG